MGLLSDGSSSQSLPLLYCPSKPNGGKDKKTKQNIIFVQKLCISNFLSVSNFFWKCKYKLENLKLKFPSTVGRKMRLLQQWGRCWWWGPALCGSWRWVQWAESPLDPSSSAGKSPVPGCPGWSSIHCRPNHKVPLNSKNRHLENRHAFYVLAKEKDLNSHLSLDVVFQNIVIDWVKIVAAHVVVVVGHRVAELLAVGGIFSIIRLVAIAVVIVALIGKETDYYSNPSSFLLQYFAV